MSEQPKCQLCGEPMPAGEEMFKYHGFSGDCPKLPLNSNVLKHMVEYFFRDTRDGKYHLDVMVDKQPYDTIECSGPSERQRAFDDLMEMQKQQGGRHFVSATKQ